MLTSMLLGWTPKGFTYIAGIQGRYFLPILPLILLFFAAQKYFVEGIATTGMKG